MLGDSASQRFHYRQWRRELDQKVTAAARPAAILAPIRPYRLDRYLDSTAIMGQFLVQAGGAGERDHADLALPARFMWLMKMRAAAFASSSF